MQNNWIDNEIAKFIKLDDILFVTAQFTDKSSDIDVYCVVKNNLQSQVHIYQKDDYQIEIFIDTWKDMKQKIENSDEIVVSFILRMDLIGRLNKKNYYYKATNLISNKYKLPKGRKKLLQYRIKVLASKYFSSSDDESRNFFKGQMIPHLIVAIFEKYGIWPESPRKWLKQLRKIDKSESKQLLEVLNKSAKIDSLVKIFTSNIEEIHLIKESKDNKVTYLG